MYSYFLEFLSVLSLNQLNKAVIDAGLAEKVLLLSARKTRRPCPAGVPSSCRPRGSFPPARLRDRDYAHIRRPQSCEALLPVPDDASCQGRLKFHRHAPRRRHNIGASCVRPAATAKLGPAPLLHLLVEAYNDQKGSEGPALVPRGYSFEGQILQKEMGLMKIDDVSAREKDQQATAARNEAASNVDVWLARGAVLVIVALQFLLVNDLTPLPRWLMPSLELALLLPLSAATAWSIGVKKRVVSVEIPSDLSEMVARHRKIIRAAFFVLTGLVSIANLLSLAGLVQAILKGQVGSGKSLLVDALNIWATNVIIFSLWYWNLDRKIQRTRAEHVPDFIFTQETLPLELTRRLYVPGYIDYLFLAFTNATAFSPSDTFPLTARAKLLMMLQALISLVTIALVASRAVGILA